MLFIEYYAAAKSLQSCPSLCDPIDGSSPGSPIPGILQARTLEWVAISLSNAWKWKVKVKSLSRVQLFATPWTTAYQAPPPWDFPGKSTGVGCHCLLWLNTIVKAKKPRMVSGCRMVVCVWLVYPPATVIAGQTRSHGTMREYHTAEH